MTKHFLAATPETVHWGYFDARLPPVLEISPGDRVVVETLSGEPEDMPGDERGFDILPEHRAVHTKGLRGPGPHFMTGPIYVRGAQPGQVLEVRIHGSEVRQNWGWNVVEPLLGTLPEDFPHRRLTHIPIDTERGTFTLPWGKELPLRPFFGVLGVAPPGNYGRISSIQPREHGGNMDNKELVAGSTLYLPIWCPGALFSAGDGHGAQGDGEVCLTALETCMRGEFEFHLRPDITLARPRAETPDTLITMAFDPDLDDAAKQALRDMIAWLSKEFRLTAENAYMLCSLCADMRITQLVDGNKGVHAVLPKSCL